jgi:phage-related protein
LEIQDTIQKTHCRLFAFWDKTDKVDTVVISTHGLVKKTDKTPPGEVEKAERIRKMYFELKNKIT